MLFAAKCFSKAKKKDYQFFLSALAYAHTEGTLLSTYIELETPALKNQRHTETEP